MGSAKIGGGRPPQLPSLSGRGRGRVKGRRPNVRSVLRVLLAVNRIGTIGPLVRAGSSMPKRHRLSPKLQSRASALRRESTFPERLLWGRLRADRLPGLKFRRQVVIGNQIVDFYCPAARLIIEIDGVSHDGRLEVDAARTERLESLGYRVVRYTNDQVLEDLDAVAEDIAQCVKHVLHG